LPEVFERLRPTNGSLQAILKLTGYGAILSAIKDLIASFFAVSAAQPDNPGRWGSAKDAKLQHIHARKYKHPHNIDKMPVQARHLHTLVGGGQRCAFPAVQEYTKQIDNACKHVESVNPGQSVKGRAKERGPPWISTDGEAFLQKVTPLIYLEQ